MSTTVTFMTKRAAMKAAALLLNTNWTVTIEKCRPMGNEPFVYIVTATR